MKPKDVWGTVCDAGQSSSYRMDAGKAGRDEIESAVSLAAETLLDVVHEFTADGFQRVDAQGRTGSRTVAHFSAFGRIRLGENGE
jgi:hypothetical protein